VAAPDAAIVRYVQNGTFNHLGTRRSVLEDTGDQQSHSLRLIQMSTSVVSSEFRALSPAVHRASTVLFSTTEDFLNRRERMFDGYSYGLYGTPTTRALEDQVAAIEGGARTVVVPSGLAALTHTLLALCEVGDHVLIADCAYGPTRSFAQSAMARAGIDVDFFPASAASLGQRLTPKTRVVLLESPGYYTMEIQDIEAIAREARAAGALVILDNSWGFGASAMFAHGVDICCTALSKYASGHADVVMGAVTVADEALFRTIKSFVAGLGAGVSSDCAYLVLRGLQSLRPRLQEHAQRGLEVSRWLAAHPAVDRVLNPALPGDPYHERFRRYFRSGNGLVSVIFRDGELEALRRMIDGFSCFRIGASWGSAHSLVSIARPSASRSIDRWPDDEHIVRFHIGLEEPRLLLADLEAGIERLGRTK
jgi:cystathionine beta-lyase